MAKENKVEYKEVTEKGDKYKRILVEFNPHFLRGSDFEIEFIPLEDATDLGKIFVSEIDSMSTIDLYRWLVRRGSLTQGIGGWEHGYLPSISDNRGYAKFHLESYRAGRDVIEPRQIVSRVKRVYRLVADKFSEPTAFAYNYFLETGQLGSLPFGSPNLTIDYLKEVIEGYPFLYRNADGEVVKRSMVEHLFDTHKTEYIAGAFTCFLETMWRLREEVMEEYREKQRE